MKKIEFIDQNVLTVLLSLFVGGIPVSLLFYLKIVAPVFRDNDIGESVSKVDVTSFREMLPYIYVSYLGIGIIIFLVSYSLGLLMLTAVKNIVGKVRKTN